MWHQTLDLIKCLVLSNLPYGWEVWICHRCRRQLPASPARHMWHKRESRMTKRVPHAGLWLWSKDQHGSKRGNRANVGDGSPKGPESAAQQRAETWAPGAGSAGNRQASRNTLNHNFEQCGMAVQTTWDRPNLHAKKSKTEWLVLGKCVWQPRRREGRL